MTEFNSQTLREFVEQKLEGTDGFVVRAEVLKNGEAVVEIDSDTRVDIDFVAALSREIESRFAPEIDDYDLEVGSVGLTTPFTLPRQFVKNIGNDVEVLTKDGRKLHGVLTEADDKGFTVTTTEKQKKEGEKKPVMVEVENHFEYADAKKVVYDLKF